MRFLVLFIFIVLFSNGSAWAQKKSKDRNENRSNFSDVYVSHLPSGEIEIDIFGACAEVLGRNAGKLGLCELRYRGVKLLVKSVLAFDFSYRWEASDGGREQSLHANVPITYVSYKSLRPYLGSSYPELVDFGLVFAVSSGVAVPKEFDKALPANTKFSPTDRIRTIESGKKANVHYSYRTVRLYYSGVSEISEQLTLMSWPYYGALEAGADRLQEFRDNIGKSDRRHLDRMEKALEEAMLSIDPKKMGEPKVPVTHRDVMEASRMVMVMGEVLSELLSDYDDVESVKRPVSVLRQLITEIRAAYGFDSGLAGTGSKAIVALTDVIELELREIRLLASLIENDTDEMSVFNSLLQKAHYLKAAAIGRSGGDAAVHAQVMDFASVWNSKAWQSTLRGLLDGGPDRDRILQGKVHLLLMAIESLSDYVRVELKLGE